MCSLAAIFLTTQHTIASLDIYRTQQILVGGKLVNLANRELSIKIFLANIHRYTENVYGICTDCCLFTKFSHQ